MNNILFCENLIKRYDLPRGCCCACCHGDEYYEVEYLTEIRTLKKEKCYVCCNILEEMVKRQLVNNS